MLIKLLRAIFGNDEEPTPPKWYRERPLRIGIGKYKVVVLKRKPMWLSTVMWALRNPAHNLTWKIIGVNGRGSWLRTGTDAAHSFALKGGWQKCRIHYTTFHGKVWTLPYISYINRWFRFRAGWGDKGNFTLLSIRSTRKDNITW